MSLGSRTNIELMVDELPTEGVMLNQNMIRKTQEIIRDMNEQQKFNKAKAHIFDALKYKHPRHESESLSTPVLFKRLYAIQSSSAWDWILFLSGWVYLCFAAFDSQHYVAKVTMESIFLLFFWMDTLMQLYCKTFDNFNKTANYSRFFYFKIVIILLMTIDLIVFASLPCYDSRPIRPFRILRCFVPLLFDPEMRKSLLSLASAYKDVLVYFIFFATIIVGYALLGNRALTFDPSYKDPVYPQNVDPYKTNYQDLGRMIFMVYVTATYDSYPDNQILAIQNYQPNYIYYIVFIFTNMFLFSSIPGSLIYIKFRDTRSKIILIDEIRQQHSLILAFVTLAERGANLSIQKLIKFLLNMYRYKIRYVEYITDICLKLDDNNNRSIQVNEFMQLTKVLLENSAMLPPSFDDLQGWVQFRKFMNKNLHLKAIVKHWGFELTVSVIIILSFINAIFLMYRHQHLLETFDGIFIWVFFVELIIRIVAYGPEVFFMDRWNNVDTLLVVVGLIFFFVPDNSNADGIVRMSRIFRLASLLRLLSHSNFMRGVHFEVWHKIKNIFAILLEIMPIILKFMHLFAFFFYIYVIFGMEVFYNLYQIPSQGSPAYNMYQQVGNFSSLVKGMYVMVQILTEAGWSMVAYDHCWRAPYYYGYIMLFFCLCHITIVYIIATLIKGIFWEVFFTVNTVFEERQHTNQQEELREEAIAKKTHEIEQINEAIRANRFLSPNTILKRELIENKFDEEIFKKLVSYYESDKHASNKHLRSKKSLFSQMHKDDWDVISSQKHSSRKKIEDPDFGERRQKIALNEIEEIEEEDFETEISEIIERLIVNPKVKYNEMVAHPKLFMQFLQMKLRNPQQFIRQDEFNMHESPIYNQESINFHLYEIHSILGIDPSKREQKAMIIQKLIDEQVLTEEHGETLIRKKLHDKVFNIDTNGTLRQVFLSGTNEQLIKKFEIEYFSDVYGYSYKRINKLTLQPLLRVEAALTYTLRNILRYPQINTTHFFQVLTNIEDQISNRLLQTGSLFKFVYKLDTEADIWFSVEYKRQQEMKVHFIKTGLWCYHKNMRQHQVSYAHDIFSWDFPHDQKEACQHYIKKFYQSFQGLAFSLLDEKQFFGSDPRDYIHDLYLQHFNVERIKRFRDHRLEISKIMVVILSKQEEREDIGIRRLPYSLSDIHADHKRIKKKIDFKFQESDNETFQKLKNLAAVEVDKIVESQGLPFSYVINLMKEISEIIKINAQNFVFQIENVLNQQYEEMKLHRR